MASWVTGTVPAWDNSSANPPPASTEAPPASSATEDPPAPFDAPPAEESSTSKTVLFCGITIPEPQEPVRPRTVFDVRQLDDNVPQTLKSSIKLVELEEYSRHSDDWDKIHDAGAGIAHLVSDSGVKMFKPALRGDNENDGREQDMEVDLQFRFTKIGIAPGFKILYFFYRDGKEAHCGELAWYVKPHLHDVKLTQVSSFVPGSLVITPGEDHKIFLEFLSTGASGRNIEPPADLKLSQSETHVLKWVKELIRVEKPRRLRFQVTPYTKDLDNLVNPEQNHAPRPIKFCELAKSFIGYETPRPPVSEQPTASEWATAPAPPAEDLTRVSMHQESFWPYKRTNQSKGNLKDVKISHNGMKERVSVIKSIGDPPMSAHPAEVKFIDARHAEAVHGFGCDLEFKEQDGKLQSITTDTHVSYIFAVGDAILLALKFKNAPTFGDQRIGLPPNTKATVELKTQTDEQAWVKVEAISSDNSFNIHADAVMIVALKDVRKLRSSASAYSKSKLQATKAFECRLSFKLPETTVARQIDAVKKALDEKTVDGSKGQLFPVLNFDGDRYNEKLYKRVNPFKGMDDTQEKFEESADWIGTQKDAVEQASSLLAGVNSECGFGMVTGCGGSGKSTIIVNKAHAVATSKTGGFTMLVSERNSVADTLCSVYNKRFPDDEPAVRVNAQQLSCFTADENPDRKDREAARRQEEYLNHQHEQAKALAVSEGRDPNTVPRPEVRQPRLLQHEEMVSFQVLQNKQEANRLRGRALPDYSVEGTIRRKIEEGVQCMAVFSFDSVVDPEFPEPVDMFAYLKDQVFAELDQHPLSEKVDQQGQTVPFGSPNYDAATDYWTDAKKARAAFALDKCKAYVVSHARVLVTTVVTAGSELVSQNFAASDPDAPIFIETDEAYTIPEASTLIPLTKCWSNYGKRIKSFVLYGDIKQLGPIIMGTPQFNEFYFQLQRSLMDRLQRAGFPIVTLDSQARQHPVLFDAANEYFYDGKVKSVLEADDAKFALPDGYHTAYAEVIGADPETIRPELTGVKERIMFCKVNGEYTRASATMSKANPAIVATVMDAVTGPLQPVYGDRMEEEVCIICPWRRQFELYEAEINKHVAEGKLTRKHLPTLRTTDNAIGSEANHVIADLTFSRWISKEMGHMKDSRRNCVLLTRGKKAEWFFVGDCKTLLYGRIEEGRVPNEIDAGSVAVAQYHANARQGDYAYEVEPPADFDILDCPRDLLLDIEREALEECRAEMSIPGDEGVTVLEKLKDEVKARLQELIGKTVADQVAAQQAEKDKNTLCNKCKEIGHRASNCTAPRRTDNVQCKKCLRYGHFKADCAPDAYVAEPPELEDHNPEWDLAGGDGEEGQAEEDEQDEGDGDEQDFEEPAGGD